MDIQEKLKISKLTHLFKIHHKIKLQLDEVCKEECDLNLVEFLEVYKSLKEELRYLKGLKYFKEIHEDLNKHSVLNSMKHD